ncbi:MAG TPA: effector binding domain-containing protein [Dissulfurispiraceae bacterium]|nr:effector binding domain-containing protein [Dissulfurispiraceae bacterium]
MKIVDIDEKRIIGLSTRTINAKEMNPSTGSIGPLWKEFDEKVEVDYKNGNRVYGVYYHYESDATGAYSVLAGTDQLDANSSAKLETITIQSGKYLVFAAKGDIPRIVFETWGKVWECFSKKDVKYERLYTTDFEHYVNQNEIEVHIAVNERTGT